MKIDLPKDLRTFAFRELTVVEPNDTDVERMLAQIFEMAIKQGRTASNSGAGKLYEEKRTSLIKDDHLSGFDDSRGQAVLDGWLRASVVEMGRVGRDRAQEQMQYVRPRTVAVFRCGFPSRARHRGADLVVYRELVREVMARRPTEEGEGKAKTWLNERFRAAFGPGVIFSDPPKWAPRYDGSGDVDITALLSLYFLEQFEAKSAVADKYLGFDSPVPAATRPLGSDVLDYVEAYGDKAPSLVMSQHLTGLIGLRLFQLPLRSAIATRILVDTGTVPPDMTDSAHNALEQYVDFTGDKGSRSDLLARECVQRDLEITRQFFWHRLYLLSMRSAPAVLPIFANAELSTAQKIHQLVQSSELPGVIAHVEYLLSQIQVENAQTDDDDTAQFLAAMAVDPRPAGLRLADVLVEALKKRGYENAFKWFWSTGGIKTDVGLLAGTLKAKSTWTYAPSDKLLSSLLAVLFSRPGGGAPYSELPIGTVLRQLEQRFGLIVDHPPTGLDTAENRAAAASNFEAFKERLQLLGVFDGLSDDLNAQRVRNPLISAAETA